MCGKLFSEGKANRMYCAKCKEAIYLNSAYRWKVANNVWVWVKHNTIARSVVDGEDYKPLREAREVIG